MRQVMWVMGRKAIGPHESNEDRPPDSVAIYIGIGVPSCGSSSQSRTRTRTRVWLS